MDINRTWKKSFRCLALVLVLGILFQSGAMAAAFTGSDGATYQLNTNSDCITSGSTTILTIDSYLTSDDQVDKEVKPCDIIFVLDQSRWVNGTGGAEREAILNAMDELLENLEEPTSGAHRVAIAGYGRVNVNQSLDSYNASEYPGQKHTGNKISLNTGYYTTDGFQSTNGWTEVKDSTTADLPQMPTAYKSKMTYENAFMTIDEAKEVIDPDTMLAWYSGASRMDAGLTLAEQLAAVAKTAAEDAQEDRNLIVCVVASSLPIQNYKSTNYIRISAVEAAAKVLKGQGATIFALGDYHNAGKGLAQDTLKNFEDTMTSVCGSSSTAEEDKANYFFSMSGSNSVTEALNEMVTTITMLTAGNTMQKVTITADNLTDNRKVNTDVTLSDWLMSLPSDLLARVEIYTYVYDEEYDYVDYNWDSYTVLEIPISELLQNGTIQYDTMLTPVSGLNTTSPEGNLVSIIVSDPVPVNYEWVGDVPSDANLPEATYITKGTPVLPVTPQVDDPHYRFDGWYSDEACQNPYVEGTVLRTDSYTLYGHWTKLCMVRYYEALTHSSSEAVNEVLTVDKNTELSTYTPELAGYTFAGWYTDSDLSTAFTDGTPITDDTDLYAKWEANTDTAYTVNYYKQNSDENGYTLADTDSLTGTTDQTIADITKTYEGYSKSSVTYESSETQAQTSPLTIQGDGSLVVNVYYDISKYTVSYALDGGSSNSEDYSPQTVMHGTAVTLKSAPVKTGYTFDGWNDGSNTNQAGDSITVTSNLTLTAQWTAKTDTTYTVKYYQQNLADNGYTEVSGNAENLTGTTGAEIKEITKTYTGFTRSATTYAATGTSASETALPIQSDGSLVVSVYYDRDTCKITYNLNGGTGANEADYTEKSVKYGGTTTTSAAPTKPGYTFAGWSDGTNTYQAGNNITVTGDLTLTAQWTPITYTVAFDANQGSGTMTAQGFIYGTAQNLTANAFTRTGYSFTGWNTQADGSGTSYADQENVSNLTAEQRGTVTLYAQWNPTPKSVTPSSAAYRVEHYKQKLDGTYELSDTDYPLYGQLNTEVSAKAKSYEHYHVSTSNSNAVLKGTVITPTVNADKKTVNLLTLQVYYDLDTCTVTYDPNNGTASTTKTLKYGETETLKEAPQKTGYTFTGWNDGTTNYNVGESIQVTTDMILTAQWTPITYTVQFNANADGVTGTMADQMFTYDTAQSLTKNTFTRTGYTFLGWNTKADGTGTGYADVANVSNLTTENGATVILYAQWTPNTTAIDPNSVAVMYKVEHYEEQLNGQYTLAETDTKYGTIQTVVTATVKSYDHYHVNTDQSALSGTVVAPALNEDKTSVNLLTLKVYYDLDSRTVTYDPNNGTESSSKTLKYGETETLEEAPEKAGYTFTGWNDGTTNYNVGDSIQVTKDLILTAQWTPITYTVAFDANQGTGTMTAQGFTYGTAQNLTANAFTRTGYSFTGWNTQEDGSGTTYADQAELLNLTTVKDETITLFAEWTPVPQPAVSLTPVETEPTTTPDETPADTTPASTVSEKLKTQQHVSYIEGYEDGTVRPNRNITRAEVATVFFRLLTDEAREEYRTTENSFTDVSPSAWYCEEVSTMANMGIMSGRTDTIFDPDTPITRAELAVVCARFDTGEVEGVNRFSDIEGHWAQADIERAAALGWIEGYEDGTFRPDRYITRAEAMTLINRVLDRVPENEDQFPADMVTWPDNQDKSQWYYLAVQESTNTYETKQKVTE
jgi:uncharacterized repeat protein (TIGR02543 family)